MGGLQGCTLSNKSLPTGYGSSLISVDFSFISVLLAGMVSLWSLAVIAFERWLVVCKPLGNFIFKPDHALACCAATWVCALGVSGPPLLGWSRSV